MPCCLAPGGQRGEQSAIDMGGVRADMPAHLFEVHGIDAAGDVERLVEPLAEAQVAHAAALEAGGPEFGRAMQDAAAAVADSPAGGAAEVEGEDGWKSSGLPLPRAQAESRVP